MRKNDPIQHIMSDQVHTVQQGQPVSEAFKLVNNKKIHHVPVVDGDRLVGIVSSTDLMQLSLGAQGYDSDQMWAFLDSLHTVGDVMTTNPKVLGESSVVRDAAEVLSSGAYHSLPVTNANGQVLGIVTSTDLIRYLCEQY